MAGTWAGSSSDSSSGPKRSRDRVAQMHLALRDFLRQPRKSPRCCLLPSVNRRKPTTSPAHRPHRPWPRYCRQIWSGREHPVFRTIVFAIVLTFAAGPNASLLCRTWCDPQAASPSDCHHERPATTVAGDDACGHDALVMTTFVREDVRRPSPAPGSTLAILIPHDQLVGPTPDARRESAPAHQRSLDPKPLSAALRI